MAAISELKKKISDGLCDEMLLDIYVDDKVIPYQKDRYVKALDSYVSYFGDGDIEIYSAPGRTEICGNHTDHQHGEIVAGSINDDAIAIVKKLEGNTVKVKSDGYDMIEVDISNLELVESEKETTVSLIKGVLKGMQDRGYAIGGFQAYITSDVLIGAGLSSSAAYESLIGTIVSGLYNDMKIDPIQIAIVGQFAENVYFGKPCGLMDQMACSVGNLVHVDFADKENPVVEKVAFDMNKHGYSLCITDTKGSHADLTPDYAAIPTEMKAVAGFFGKEVLLGVTIDDLMDNFDDVRKVIGDRGVLRSIHFINENVRVQKMVASLKCDHIEGFLNCITESGNSSFKYLQNVYSPSDVATQNVSLALALSELFLDDNGVCRVHGGGFAGTIQAFVKNDAVEDYKVKMDKAFGEGSCKVLKIRKYGGMKVL